MEKLNRLLVERLPEGVCLATSEEVQGPMAQATRSLKQLKSPVTWPGNFLRNTILKQADISVDDFLKSK